MSRERVHTCEDFTQKTKNYLYGFLFLKLFDFVATWYGISTGYGVEVNPIMRFFYSNTLSAFCFKIISVSLLCISLYIAQREAPHEKQKTIYVVFYTLSVIFMFVALLHLVNYNLYLYFLHF